MLVYQAGYLPAPWCNPGQANVVFRRRLSQHVEIKTKTPHQIAEELVTMAYRWKSARPKLTQVSSTKTHLNKTMVFEGIYIYIHIPIGSMYGIYGNIYHQHIPNVSIYTIHGSYGVYIYIIGLYRDLYRII